LDASIGGDLAPGLGGTEKFLNDLLLGKMLPALAKAGLSRQ